MFSWFSVDRRVDPNCSFRWHILSRHLTTAAHFQCLCISKNYEGTQENDSELRRWGYCGLAILKWVWWILKLKDGSTWQGDMTYIWSSTVQSAFQTNISTELFSPFYNNQSTIRLAFVGFRITHLKDGLIFSLRNVGKIHKKWFSQIKLNLLYTDNNNFETDADNNNWGHIYNISNSLFKFVQFFFVLPAISVLRTQNHIPAIQYAYSQEHMLLLWRLKWCILLHTSVISLFHDWFRIL